MRGIGGDSSSRPSGERGQSSVIGVVLVVAITVMGVTGIVLFGSSALMDAKSQSEIESAEHAMTQLDSRFSLVALGSSERQSSAVDLRSGAAMHIDQDRGWMNVSVVNLTTDDVDPVLNTSLGAVVYEKDDTTIAYQGGGVWKQGPGGGSVMVSPPEFHYRTTDGDDPTLTLPVVVIRGSGTVTDRATVSEKTTVPGYPIDGNPDRLNPLTEGSVNVTVHSEYYEAWGAFFEDRTGGIVTFDHEAETVTITITIQQSSEPVQGGLVSGAAGSTLEFKNQAETDSYNSTDGPYSSSNGDNTSIVAAGGFYLRNKAVVHGNLRSGGSVTLDPNAKVTGDVEYGGTLTNDGTIEGETEGGADVAIPKSVDWLIDERREAIQASNDNGDADVDISGNSLAGCAGTCELDTGQYYLDGMDLAGRDLLLDTSDGDVEVVVDGDVDLGDSKVEVVGGNRSKFYIEGDVDELGGAGNVTVAGERSPGMWFFMNPGATFTFGNGARFVGVIYGPGNGAQDGVYTDFENHVTIYGGIVGDVDYVDNHIEVHFDEALVEEDPLAGHAAGQPTVAYLHVSKNEVNVSDR